MGYGTGAIMAVPAHDERDFEFCRKYGIAIRPVIRPVDGELASSRTMTEAFTDDGIVENSGPWSGLPSEEARREMAAHAEREGLRQSRHHVPHQGLGHLAPALLGHADSGDPLPEVRRGARARRSAARAAAAMQSRSPARAARRSKTCPSSST
jgi:hypothetical protein